MHPPVPVHGCREYWPEDGFGGLGLAIAEEKDKVVIDTENPTILFVYGSLKKGHKHHGMLGKSNFLGDVKTEPHYLMYDTGPYPGMIAAKNGDGRCIEGELYEVEPEQMLKLDKAVPYQFKKKEIKLKGMEKTVITHVWDYGVDRFLDCGTSWPRE